MSISITEKEDLLKQYQLHDKDVGSVEVQVSFMTTRIKNLTKHLQNGNKKDLHTKRGLLKIISKRTNLLKYLKRTDVQRYGKLISSLKLRDNV